MKKFFSLFLITILAFSSVVATATENTYFNSSDVLNREKISLKNLDTIKLASDLSLEKSLEANATITTGSKKNEIEVFNHNGSQLRISKSDIDLMAKLVYAESRGEPFPGKVAVASVVLNRVMSPKFPNTIEGVIFQKNAFSCVVNGRLNTITNESCYDAVYEAIRGKDPTNEALFFYNPSIATCSWMRDTSKKDSKVIGNHTFFKQ